MSERMENCENCGREFPETKVHSHYAYCRRNIRKCRECGEFIDVTEEEEHIQQMHFRQPCQHCARCFPRGQVAVHELNCQSRTVTCQFCEMLMKAGQLDEHVSVCGARTRQCVNCGRNVLMMDQEKHAMACMQAQNYNKKTEQPRASRPSEPLYNATNTGRQAPPPVPAKYRVERLTDDIPMKPPQRQPSYSEDDYSSMGFSEEDIQAQRAIFEHLEQQKRSTRQRC